jgi:asparagine synthase (glutamine-hydrolysing)
MCGIVGVRRFGRAPAEGLLVRRMAAELVHRGPDAEGYFTGEGVAFGHRRLSIIDVGGSHQPMSAGPAHVSFNGEIFNYQALRRELTTAGYVFQTQGDTEVLLATYLRYGADGVKRLEGQFAYALYDERTRELWLYRDRLGILPLYYTYQDELFVFASEIKAILPALPSPPAIDEQAVREYLAHRSVPAPYTLFRGIHKLPPGHRARLDATGRLHIEPYWQLPIEPSDSRFPDAAALEQVERGLEQAVASRLVADVPVGAFLSGGVDSSLIVALMTRLREGSPVETFSAGFDDPRYDELPHARAVSQQLGTRHHEVIVRAGDFESLWAKLTWHRDAPISEPADVAIFRLSELARSSVKVLLSGEGSDELFAGYPKYRVAHWAALADAMPPALRVTLFRSIERFLPPNAARLRIMVRAMTAPNEADRFQAWFAPFTAYERQALFPGEDRHAHREIWSRARGDLLQRMLYVDCHTWLVDNLLERGDRMAMAASVESRPPFLDHRLVELAFRLPSRMKLRHGTSKWIIKEVARRYLPTSIVDRPKIGFRVPLDAWFRGHLREMARDLLLAETSFVGGHMSRSRIEHLLEDHETGRRDEESRIWTLLCLEVWHQVFLRNDAAHRAAKETGS